MLRRVVMPVSFDFLFRREVSFRANVAIEIRDQHGVEWLAFEMLCECAHTRVAVSAGRAPMRREFDDRHLAVARLNRFGGITAVHPPLSRDRRRHGADERVPMTQVREARRSRRLPEL